MSFSELGLGDKLLEAIRDAGYSIPTPIQAQAIPFVLQGRDVLGCAQTGTGKTASFVLPMIEKLAAGRARARMPRSLILEPTRELAAQVEENFEKYGRQHRLTTALIIGGESMSEQTKKLDRGVDVLIATPGRLIDQFERGNILLTDIKILVVDECDRMLDMGFIPDIEKIVGRLPRARQTLMFSATLPPEIRRLSDRFLSNPEEITVAPPASTAAGVEQSMLRTNVAGKRDALIHLLEREPVKNAFIFCNRKRDIAALEKALKKHGFNAGALHGDMVQSARQQTLESFKKGELTLMVCSDVAARGLDVSAVSHVFNFDVPHHAEDYVHRIGRTGRAGMTGKAYMLVTPDDFKSLAAIVKLTGKEVPEITMDGVMHASASSEGSDPAPSTDQAVRPRGRSRGGRSRTSHAVTDVAAGQPEAAAPAPIPAKPREDRPPRHEGQDRNRPDRAFREPSRSAERRRQPFSRRPHMDDDLDDTSVVGFGDDMPAFLKVVPRFTTVVD
jgi:superfamily II DNA/RNA helicase